MVGGEAAPRFERQQRGEIDGGDRSSACLFWGDMLSRSHLHTARYNKEIQSDYAGSFVSITAPAIAVCNNERTRHLLLMVGY